MLDETLAVRPGPVRFGLVFYVPIAENFCPRCCGRELVGVIVRMSALVPEYLHAPFICPALYFQHLMKLQLFEPRMSEIEGDGYKRRSLG